MFLLRPRRGSGVSAGRDAVVVVLFVAESKRSSSCFTISDWESDMNITAEDTMSHVLSWVMECL